MFVIMAMRESDLHTNFENIPTDVNDVAESKLKMANIGEMLLILTKLFFDLINCGQASAVSAHRNYDTYLYRRNQWLKPLVSDSLGYTK